MVLMVSFGILAGQLLLFLLMGLLGVRLYGRFRESRPDGYALHSAYWAGLLRLKGRTTPNPYIRLWLP